VRKENDEPQRPIKCDNDREGLMSQAKLDLKRGTPLPWPKAFAVAGSEALPVAASAVDGDRSGQRAADQIGAANEDTAEAKVDLKSGEERPDALAIADGTDAVIAMPRCSFGPSVRSPD
jgi:hypothetical protein